MISLLQSCGVRNEMRSLAHLGPLRIIDHRMAAEARCCVMDARTPEQLADRSTKDAKTDVRQAVHCKLKRYCSVLFCRKFAEDPKTRSLEENVSERNISREMDRYFKHLLHLSCETVKFLDEAHQMVRSNFRVGKFEFCEEIAISGGSEPF